MSRQQAEAEGLTLLVADNKAGYYGVYLKPGQPKPYQAQVSRGCRADLGEGRHCNKCPLDNNAETRQLVKNRRNNFARRNPIVL